MSIKQLIAEMVMDALDEKLEIDHSRYMRAHGKKAKNTSGSSTWMFTSEPMGEPKSDEMVTVSGDLKTAAKEAAKKLGVNRIYVMEETDLNEMKQPFIVIDTADNNKVVAMASDEKGAKSSIASSERPPMSIKDKSTLKIVKSRKKQDIGYPLKEETNLSEDIHNNLNDIIFDFQKKLMNLGTKGLDPTVAREVKKLDNMLDDLRQGPLFKIRPGK
jgi:hypothetical protein